MARLRDDCFAAGTTPLGVDGALGLLAARLSPVTSHETLPLDQALGRALASDIVAAASVPPHDNAAVDGWAVRAADLDPAGDTRLAVGPRLAAGQTPTRPLAPGQAVRIFTGAHMPPGADTVVMQEDCERRDETVVVPAGVRAGANRRRAGEDVAAGSVILRRGRRLGAAEIGLAASVGLNTLPVHTPLSVAVFSTGDELREPGAGSVVASGAIYDSNRYALKAMLRRLGCSVTDLGIVGDDRADTEAALSRAAAGHHAVVTTGGMSTGEEDHVRAAVERRGRLDAWRLAIKPGRPAALGVVEGRAFIGLPGNPAAMIVTFLLLGRPVLLRLGGFEGRPPHRFPVIAGFAHAKRAGRREYLRVRLDRDAEDAPLAHLAGGQGSGMLSSLAAADGLLELPEDLTHLSPGDRIAYLPFSEVMG